VAARLDVPDPRLKILQGTPALFRAVRIRVTEPDPPAGKLPARGE
jgi:hypothetical protein